MMLSFQLGVLLVPYFLVLAGTAALAWFNIQHLIHYGETSKVSFMATFAYLAGTVYILFFTWSSLQGVDWRQPIVITPPALTAPAASLP